MPGQPGGFRGTRFPQGASARETPGSRGWIGSRAGAAGAGPCPPPPGALPPRPPAQFTGLGRGRRCLSRGRTGIQRLSPRPTPASRVTPGTSRPPRTAPLGQRAGPPALPSRRGSVGRGCGNGPDREGRQGSVASPTAETEQQLPHPSFPPVRRGPPAPGRPQSSGRPRPQPAPPSPPRQPSMLGGAGGSAGSTPAGRGRSAEGGPGARAAPPALPFPASAVRGPRRERARERRKGSGTELKPFCFCSYRAPQCLGQAGEARGSFCPPLSCRTERTSEKWSRPYASLLGCGVNY